MKRTTQLVTGGAVVLAYTAFVAWMFCLSKIENHAEVMNINIFILAGYLLAVYCVNYFAAGRGLSLSIYALLQLVYAAGAGFVFSHAVSLYPAATGTMVLIGILYAIGVVVTAMVASEAPGQNGLITCFEIVVVMAVILLLLDHTLDFDATKSALPLLLAAGAMSLIGLIADRVQREDTTGAVKGSPIVGRVIIAVIVAVVTAFAVLLAVFALDGMHSLSQACLAAINWCINAIKTAAAFVLHVIERILLWLSQFADDEPIEAVEMGTGVDSTAGIYDDVQMSLPPWLGYAAAALVVALVAYVLFRMRREHMRKRRVVRKKRRSTHSVRQSGFADTLKRLVARLKQAIIYRYHCLRYRKTAAGMLAWCERRAAKTSRRGSDESGEQFLRRLSGGEHSAEQSRALKNLAELVEQSFYSTASPTVPAEVYKAVRSCKFT